MPADFGPIYTETQLGRFPVEPWNTASNFAFLVIIIYFGWLTRFDVRRFPFLSLTIPILGVGFIGGTLFHATRVHKIWLYLDFIPIFVLAVSSALFFWLKIISSKLWACLACILTLLAPRLLIFSLGVPRGLRISLGYTALAVAILLPAVLAIRARSWQNLRWLLGSVIAFSAAITFRILDRHAADGPLAELFPMGTHFLWHLFGALSVYCMMRVVYEMEANRGTEKIGLEKVNTTFSGSAR
ncbi:MAG: hypothetical protein DCC75_11280 [Proteobacteria bacterium]|nr:MAG: hypothetical protein DCC75_11280 [Pseudomonadota bacterium]